VPKIRGKRKEIYRKNGLVGQIVLELMPVRFFGQKFGDSEEKSGYKIHFFRYFFNHLKIDKTHSFRIQKKFAQKLNQP
jgi:hypothetical protein